MTTGSSPDTTVVNTIAKILKEKKTIAICLPTQATQDAVASGLALCFALENEGKTVGIAASDLTDPAFNLVGQDEIRSSLTVDGDVLVVSIPYKDGGVENVSYAVEGEKLNIVISPEAGRAKIEPASVTFSYTGGKPDVIVTIYTPTLQALGPLYENHVDQFSGVEIINIDRHFTNNEYGTVNYVDKKSPSLAQMINEVLRVMKVEMDHDIATNLYDALVSATNNFSSYTVNAQAFRMAAFLLEHGATKRPIPIGQPAGQLPGQMNGAMSGGMEAMDGIPMGPSEGAFEQESYDYEGTAENGEGESYAAPSAQSMPAPRPVPVQPEPVPVAQPAPVVEPAPVAPAQVQPEAPAPAQVTPPAPEPVPKPEAPITAHTRPEPEAQVPAPVVPQPVQLKPQIFNKGTSGLNKG